MSNVQLKGCAFAVYAPVLHPAESRLGTITVWRGIPVFIKIWDLFWMYHVIWRISLPDTKSLFKTPRAYCNLHLNQRAPAPKLKVYTSIWVYWHWSTYQAWLYSKLLWKQPFHTLSELSVRLGGSPKSNVCVLLHVFNFLFFCEAYKKHSMQTRITGSSCLMYLWFEMTDHLYYS